MRTNNDNNELLLIDRLKNGDTKAFDTLFTIYGPRLYVFTNGYLKSRFDSEEVVQEVFLTIWRKRKDIDASLSFKSYLFKIAYHLILEAFNKIRKRDAFKHEMLEQAVPFTNDLEERLDYQMLLEKVDRIIKTLPTRQQEVVIMRKKEGVAVKEIARQLEISPKTVENHLTEALKSLKKELNEEGFSGLLLFSLFFC